MTGPGTTRRLADAVIVLLFGILACLPGPGIAVALSVAGLGVLVGARPGGLPRGLGVLALVAVVGVIRALVDSDHTAAVAADIPSALVRAGLPWLVAVAWRMTWLTNREADARIIAQRRNYHDAVQRERDAERIALAEDLHDHLGHSLTLAALRLGRLELDDSRPIRVRTAVVEAEPRRRDSPDLSRFVGLLTICRGPPHTGGMTAHLSPLLKQATPVVVDHALGSWIHGTDGRDYLDFTTGIGVTSTGHCHPDVVAAAQEQCGKIIHAQYTTVMHQPLLALTEKLGAHLPEGIDSVFYANSGSEAVEAAVRLARMATGRPTIVTIQGGFHGRTVAAASLTTAGTRFSAGFSPLMGGVVMTPFPHALRHGWTVDDAVDFALAELDYLMATRVDAREIAAFLIEPVLGDGGYLATPPRYLQGLRERADRIGALLVLDEVQAGIGRTGRFWGHQHTDGLVPDIIITAKGIASGFPISAIAAPEALMAKAWPGSQGGTYGGNAVAAAAGVATLGVVEREGLVANSAERGTQLLDGLRRSLGDVSEICDIRGTGLMLGVEFGDPTAPAGSTGALEAARLAGAVQQACIDEDLLTLTCGPTGSVVRLIPALVVTPDEVDAGIERVTRAVHRVCDGAA